VALGSWWWVRTSRARWVQEEALPEIERLVDVGREYAALKLVREARSSFPDDPELQRLEDQLTMTVSIRTSPPGADVYLRDYRDVEGDWDFLGSTPLQGVAVPATFDLLRWKLVKEGFQTADASHNPPDMDEEIVLIPEGEHPHMVRVTGAPNPRNPGPPAPFEDYLLDKYEVTNEEYRAFLDAGGYRDPRFWTEPFTRGGETLPWDEAMAEFRDRTGRAGPSTWEVGGYPEEQGAYPVRGVSWYEGAAYCASVGKTLPSYHHWLNAAGPAYVAGTVTGASNFSGDGPAAVATFQGVGPYGTYDMAGNVKEWCWNQSGDRRFILGGAWDEAAYMYLQEAARPPWTREANFGFRCALYEEDVPESLLAPIESKTRDYRTEKPVSDEVFETIRSFYSYDARELDAEVESVDDSARDWRMERVSFDAAYGNERVIANLYIPREAIPPHQAVVYFPGVDAFRRNSIEKMDFAFVEFVVRSGRAVLCPMYKGMYERRSTTPPGGEKAGRDRQVQWFKDLARSVDYLCSRDDVDDQKLAYFGFSWGAIYGLISTALEDRFRASILLSGGLPPHRRLTEVDPFQFVSRIRTPTLVINGREDFVLPLEASIQPMYDLLGVAEPAKKLVLIDAGHNPPRLAVIRETLDWLDLHLGPVEEGVGS
jgi:formylglycine-generating enzyme required for sulfatase activity/predicted esterase